jgi:hypothetical protein
MFVDGLRVLEEAKLQLKTLVRMIGKGNRSTATVPLVPLQIPHDLTGLKSGPPQWEASEEPTELWHGLNESLTFSPVNFFFSRF